MPDIPPSAPFPLDYAAAPPRWRKRVRRILLTLILLASALSVWRWGPYAWRQVQVLYYQQQCMNFTASPDTVVYDEDPAAAARLLQRPDYSAYVLKRQKNFNDHPTPFQAAAFDPQCFRALSTFTSLPAWTAA